LHDRVCFLAEVIDMISLINYAYHVMMDLEDDAKK